MVSAKKSPTRKTATPRKAGKRATAPRDVTGFPAQTGKRGRKPPPPGETKRDRFVRLCEHRMAKAINAIELLGNLSAPHYAWVPEDLDPMHTALMDTIERTFSRFEARAPRKDTRPFKLN